MAKSSDLSKNELSCSENIDKANHDSDRFNSITVEIIDVLQLEDNECKDQIINDLFEGGRQALVKYKDDIISETYEAEMNGQECKLLNLLKNYFHQQWETQYGASNQWFLVFLDQYKNGEKQGVFEDVLIRTAEYGQKYMKGCPILSIILQLLFEDIDDDCLQKTSVFNDLWFTVTTKGVNPLKNNDEQSTIKFSDYITENVMNEQTNNTDSALFHALHLYHSKVLSSLFEESKVRVNDDTKSMTLNSIANDGLLKGIEVVKTKTTRNSYKKLLENVTVYLKSQKEKYLSEGQITNDSPSIETNQATASFSLDVTLKEEKVENEIEDLSIEFRNLLISLLREHDAPLKELDVDQISSLLYNKNMEPLENIKDILMHDEYNSFHTKFINHPRIQNIWQIKQSDRNEAQENNCFQKFKNELRTLWQRYHISNELDFNTVAEWLYRGDADAFETIEDYILPNDFEQFKNDFMKNKKISEVKEAKKQDVVNDTYKEFRSKIIKLLELENIPSNKANDELLVKLLYDDQGAVPNILNDHLKNVIIPKKIKSLINKVQSNEKLNTLWNSKLAPESSDNLLISVQNVLEKYHFDKNVIDMVISKLNIDFRIGLQLIEDECTPDDFNQIKAELLNNKEIQSKINDTTETNSSSLSEEKTNKELLEIELTKIWKENNFKDLDQSSFNEFIQCLLDNGIKQAIEFITPKVIKKQLSALIIIIDKNEKIQNIIKQPKEENEQYINIKNIQTTLLGHHEHYLDDLFSKIIPLDFKKFENIIREVLNNHSNQSLLDIMMPFIMNKLKKGIDLSGLCASKVFWDNALPVYGTDQKTTIICIIERYKDHQIYFVSLLKKLGIALPFTYTWIVENKIMFKMPLRAYSHCLAIDHPMIISLGSNSIGKSTLLNKIFDTQFITNKDGKINDGIDVTFSTPEFSCGFIIFDVHDHAHKQQNLLRVFCNMLPKKQCWIFLQTTSIDEVNVIVNMLLSFNYINDQIICIMRDCEQLNQKQRERLQQYGLKHIFPICRIQHNSQKFDSNLVSLRESLFSLTGIGEKSTKLPNNAILREDYNAYAEIEDNLRLQQFDDICIDIQDEQTRSFCTDIDKLLKNINKNRENLQSFLFKHIEANNKIQDERRRKATLIGKDTEEKTVALSRIDQSIANLSKVKESVMPSDLVLQYNKLFIEKKFNWIIEMDRLVCAWQSPILSPLFKQRNSILDELRSCETTIKTLQTENKNPKELDEVKRIKEQLEKQKIQNSQLIDKQTINKDFFMRELLSIYSDNDFLEKQHTTNELLNRDLYISSFVEYIMKSNEIEIIDGDNNEFNTKIVADIFRQVETKLGESEEPYVVSVIGPQSTGKSTLLNMLFGSNFQMSAGRCTKGLYASLFKTDYPNAKTLMVLDTEGLMSIEKANEEYDKKLTVFSMACSQIMLINLNGEINAAMKKILTISLFAANQLKIFKTRPVIIFILRNMMDLNVDKQKEMIDSVKKELKEVSELSQLDLTQVLDFKEEKAFFLMLTAFNKDSVYNGDKELFQKSTTNAKFAELIQDLRKVVFDEATIISKNGKKFKSLSDWVKQATEIWSTLNLFNNFLMIESIKEINERKELGEIITRIMQHFIEPNLEKTSFRSKLDAILIEQEATTDVSVKSNSDVEQRFDDEEIIFTNKVKNEFSQETEKRSFAEKLIKEYNDRLCYAIKSSKTQAVEKYKALAQKRKIQGKIEAAVLDLQIRSEAKILEWQKTKGNISDDQVATKKNELKEWFETSMNETRSQIKTNLESNKKTADQWRNFVKNQIKSATGTIPVEKVFYSDTTLHQKAAGIISSSNNIITLMDTEHESIRNAAILKKIPILMNNRRKKIRAKKQNSNNAPAIPVRTRHEKLHIEKSENKLVTKWRQFTTFVSNMLTFSHDASNSNQVSHENHCSNQPTYEDLSDLYDVCIDSDALVLIYSMFFEMNEYLKNKIKKEIFERAEYEIICLKQHLLEIQAKMCELSQKFLDDDDLEFTVNFGTELVEWLYDIILEKLMTDEKNTYEKLQNKATDNIENILRDFESRLDKTFSDMDNAELMATKLFNNVKCGCLSKTEREYKQKLKQETILQPDQLVRKSDEVFYETNGTYKTDEIYDYMTKMLEYMNKVYTVFFDTKDATIKSICEQNYDALFDQQCKILIKNLEQLESIFKDSTTTEVQPTDNGYMECVQDFVKTYLEGRSTFEKLDELSKKRSLQLTYLHPNELDNPDILFKNVPLYPMTNPRVFIGTLAHKIKVFYENETNKSEPKFILSDDMLRERDQIKDTNLQEALGCIEQCPFCGCKCEERMGEHDAHKSDKHRLMAFNGSYELLPNGRKGFVFDLCNSEFTIRHSKWKENSSSQLSVHDSKEIKERMSQYSVGQGDVTITLKWSDSNDLDLHVKCPCGTELFYGNTRCSTCSGYLDRDMNVCCCGATCPQNKCSSTIPIESVFFKPAKSGIYTVSVVYFSGPKGTAGTKTNYEVRVATHSNAYVQCFNGYVESSGPRKTMEVGEYEHSQGVNFLEHVKKNFPPWRNIRIIDDKYWENILKKAWFQVASRMSQHYGFEDNTPTEFRNLNV